MSRGIDFHSRGNQVHKTSFSLPDHKYQTRSEYLDYRMHTLLLWMLNGLAQPRIKFGESIACIGNDLKKRG